MTMKDSTIYNNKENAPEKTTITGCKGQSDAGIANDSLAPESTLAAIHHESSDGKRNTPSDTSIWKKIKSWHGQIKYQFSSTYSKRNPIVNALLSLFLLMTIILSLLVSIFLIMISSKIDNIERIIGITWTYYPLFCIYYMCKFVIGNHKNAILPSFMGTTLVWYVIFSLYALISTPDSAFLDEDGNESALVNLIMLVFPLILSLVFNAIVYGILYIVMKFRKYEATAWTLLDVSRGKRPKLEKISFAIFFGILILSVGVIAYNYYKLKHPIDKYPSHLTAKIGDYYYYDGTISSELLPDKKAVGMVFSLETSEKEKQMGYTHGQIVCLSDISPNAMQWDSSDIKDYERYPNYTWENRLKALEDINGYYYTNCEKHMCLTINRNSMKYMKGEIDGASDWYVPTAGQWARILENIGKVKVDRMLKFEAETASRNLKKININPQRWYWTITEFDAENAWSIRLTNGEFGSRSNKQNRAYVRPVASF